MKNLNYLIVFSLVLFSSTLHAQSLFKLGPTFMAAYSDMHATVSPAAGIEVSYEVGIHEKFSANFAIMGMYGHNRLEEDKIPYVQHDYHLGGQIEVRYHFKERYKGNYVGIGMDQRLLTAVNFFPPIPNEEDAGTLEDWETSVGVSYGAYFETKKGKRLNPYVYAGVDPRAFGGNTINEYPAFLRFGLNYGLN
ncbi:MAG: DUF3575 domain-containing protein [Bacteroidia bacterium]|nr:DUF3575 domain-containing protein [Bacteroidia bacterium]